MPHIVLVFDVQLSKFPSMNMVILNGFYPEKGGLGCPMDTKLRVIKRNASEVGFDPKKIEVAIGKANSQLSQDVRIDAATIADITQRVVSDCVKLNRAIQVEEIQDMVERHIVEDLKNYQLAKEYITYRYMRAEARRRNTTDDKVLALLRHDNELAKQENANKNPIIISTMRDYLASEVSEDICKRYVFPEHLTKAHEEGLIHIHDRGYISGSVTNCELVNLEDMLQNGTVISNTLIEKPHSFAVACNIATQIIAQVASNTFGGQTITLSHLAPFVDVSRQRYRRVVREELESVGEMIDDEKINKIAEDRVHREIVSGIQTIQYQLQTLLTTNGGPKSLAVVKLCEPVISRGVGIAG